MNVLILLITSVWTVYLNVHVSLTVSETFAIVENVDGCPRGAALWDQNSQHTHLTHTSFCFEFAKCAYSAEVSMNVKRQVKPEKLLLLVI